MAPRSKKSKAAKQNIKKRWAQDRPVVDDRPNSQVDDLSNSQIDNEVENVQKPKYSIRQEKLLSRADSIGPSAEDNKTCTYIILDSSQLSSLLKKCEVQYV